MLPDAPPPSEDDPVETADSTGTWAESAATGQKIRARRLRGVGPRGSRAPKGQRGAIGRSCSHRVASSPSWAAAPCSCPATPRTHQARTGNRGGRERRLEAVLERLRRGQPALRPRARRSEDARRGRHQGPRQLGRRPVFQLPQPRTTSRARSTTSPASSRASARRSGRSTGTGATVDCATFGPDCHLVRDQPSMAARHSRPG